MWIPRPCARANRSSRSCLSRRPSVCAARAGVQKKTRAAPRVAGGLRPPARGQHGGPPAGRGGEVDSPRPPPDRGSAGRRRPASQLLPRRPDASCAGIQETQAIEDERHETSRAAQRAVRENRLLPFGLHRAEPARAERRHQEEGNAGQLPPGGPVLLDGHPPGQRSQRRTVTTFPASPTAGSFRTASTTSTPTGAT